MEYIRFIWPNFIEGDHHRVVADKLTAVAKGDIKRLIVNMPPRHTKSEFASVYFPSWVMGLKPDMKIMQTTHTADLSVRFGRKVRNLMDSDEYASIFPKVSLSADSKSAGRWETSQGGEYFAAGVGGAITGRGADLLIIDDPHSEQDALSPNLLESAYEWYTSGPRQRLQPGGTIVIVMTRWSTLDLTAKLLNRQTEVHADQWEVVELPAIFEDSGNVLWPEFWKKEELEAVKASIPVTKWNAQYQQNPTSEEGAIIKREWWNIWEDDSPPPCHYIIQSYDTAFSKKQTADYSAITTWGIFSPGEDKGDAIVLLNAERGRWDFPELKAIAMDQYEQYEPDVVLIEAQASGTPLTHELRTMGVPVTNYRPSRGNDKMTRVHAVSPVFEAGMVWAPDRMFAEEVVEECASFPFGEHDDYVDSMTQAILRFRQGNFISLYSDEAEEEMYRQKRVYYQETIMAALSLFFKEGGKALTKKGREALEALREMERGVSTRAGGKKAQGLERISGTTTRNLGKGFGLRDPKTGKMATKGQRAAVVGSGRKRIGAGAAALGTTPVIINQLLKADEEATEGSKKDKTGLKNFGGKGSGKGSGKSTGAKTESKTFRERRLARMKRRLEAAENEGRKRRLKRRITRVEGRIEDAEDRRKAKKKNMGGMMKKKGYAGGGMIKSKMASKGGKKGGMMPAGYKTGGMAKQGADDRLDESLGMRRGKESTKSQSMKSRRDESRGARKKSTPQSAGVAKRGWGAVIR